MIFRNLAAGIVTCTNEATGYGQFKRGNVLDGDLTSRWSATSANAYWKIDLGVPTLVNLVQIMTGTTSYSFTVDGSNDDSNWTSFITAGAAIRNAVTDFTGFYARYRYYRVQFTDGANWSAMNIFKLFNTKTYFLHARRDRLDMRGVSIQNQLE